MEGRNQEQLDRLLREANVFRMRRQFEQAEERCRAALEIASATVPVAPQASSGTQSGSGRPAKVVVTVPLVVVIR